MSKLLKAAVVFAVMCLMIALTFLITSQVILYQNKMRGEWKIGDNVSTYKCYQTGTIESIQKYPSGYIVTIASDGPCVAFIRELEPNPLTVTSAPK